MNFIQENVLKSYYYSFKNNTNEDLFFFNTPISGTRLISES